MSGKQPCIRVTLALYDLIIFLTDVLLLFVLHDRDSIGWNGVIIQTLISFACIFGARCFGKIYLQIWRYGGIQCYIRLILVDLIGLGIYYFVQKILTFGQITSLKLFAFCCINTLLALSMRLMYCYAYKMGSLNSKIGSFFRFLVKFFSGGRVQTEADFNKNKIRIAIIGAGTVGTELAENLLDNTNSRYLPKALIDINPDKIGRIVRGLTVYEENEQIFDVLKDLHIQEVVFAVPNMSSIRRKELYHFYRSAGFKIKIFDAPAMETAGSTKRLRDFEISDLLFRDERELINNSTKEYYLGKVVLITGGGGSIGAELCRQIAAMKPKQLIILDNYENCAYELKCSLYFQYKEELDAVVEIVSVTNLAALERVFQKYRPDICIHAAAHKHVPLMENNCIEAVENNVFGTLNVVKCCEKYECGRFMLVSTDKAVNPTSIMGATKRVCEMIMQAYSTKGKVICSATRFGNVLGSAGSVIPLFQRQIAAGGPVTVTDKRVIRYFMTIPEASQLVLTSGAMANNGELFVLDMGKPVKIWELAQNMITLSGAHGVEIIETGLRPGEKLYEELLVNKTKIDKTNNDLIYIDHELPVSMEELDSKLTLLIDVCLSGSNEKVRDALRKVVPTFRTPEEVNAGK